MSSSWFVYLEGPLVGRDQEQVFSTKNSDYESESSFSKEKYQTRSAGFNIEIHKKKLFQKFKQLQSNFIEAQKNKIDSIRKKIEEAQEKINENTNKVEKIKHQMEQKAVRITEMQDIMNEWNKDLHEQKKRTNVHYEQWRTAQTNNDPQQKGLKQIYDFQFQRQKSHSLIINNLFKIYLNASNEYKQMKQSLGKLEESILKFKEHKDQLKARQQLLISQLKAFEQNLKQLAKLPRKKYVSRSHSFLS